MGRFFCSETLSSSRSGVTAGESVAGEPAESLKLRRRLRRSARRPLRDVGVARGVKYGVSAACLLLAKGVTRDVGVAHVVGVLGDLGGGGALESCIGDDSAPFVFDEKSRAEPMELATDLKRRLLFGVKF